MLRFAANLSMLFTELPFKARFAAARMAGFKGVEILFPYDHEAGEIAAELESNGLTQVLFNLPPGDFEAGERGLAALPGREREFEAAAAEALDYAGTLKCAMVHVMAGIPHFSDDPDTVLATFVANLRQFAAEAARQNVTLLIEPINQRDIPGYFLSQTETARRIIDTVAADNVGLQLDLYHRQVMQGDLVHAIRDNLDIARHIQIANPPDRADPGTGEINYPYIFRELESLGYAGWIGCEYRPKATTRDSLAWYEAYRGR
jgi:hydroxypyruvate isomerase